MQGQLVHASIGLPGGRGLLSPIFKAVATQKPEIIINPNLRQCLKDWKILINAIANRPTSVLELVAQDPQYIAYVDSSKAAVGGIWTSGTNYMSPIVWRMEWPLEIQNQLVSSKNKNGKLSINDLELAGILLSWLVLEKITKSKLKHTHIGMFCDNASTVQWINNKKHINLHNCRTYPQSTSTTTTYPPNITIATYTYSRRKKQYGRCGIKIVQ